MEMHSVVLENWTNLPTDRADASPEVLAGLLFVDRLSELVRACTGG